MLGWQSSTWRNSAPFVTRPYCGPAVSTGKPDGGPQSCPRGGSGSLSRAQFGWRDDKDSLPEWSKGVDSSPTMLCMHRFESCRRQYFFLF